MENERAPRNVFSLKSFKDLQKKDWKKFVPVVIAAIVIFLGVGTGYVLASNQIGSSRSQTKGLVSTKNTNEAGVQDESRFKDNAEGMLLDGGIGAEGTHHIDRGLGETKFVYLTSTMLDLNTFVGKKVKVWGETIASKKAGWLMDVMKIKIVE